MEPTREAVRVALDIADSMDLSDGAYWCVVHELLGLEYGDVFPILGADPDYFGLEEA